MTVKIYQFENSEQEVHMMGEYVGVCWNLKREKKKIKGEDGKTYSAEVFTKSVGDYPYIDFVHVREREGHDPWKDDDSPVDGGLTPHEAIKVAIELKQACDYILNEGWKK